MLLEAKKKKNQTTSDIVGSVGAERPINLDKQKFIEMIDKKEMESLLEGVTYA